MKSKHAETLLHLIENRQLTSVELSRMTNVGYPPRKIQMLEDNGIKIIHDRVPYTTSEGRKTTVARYTLLSPMKVAKSIYKKLAK